MGIDFKYIIYCLIILCFTSELYGQNGAIFGLVSDKKTGEPLIGAQVNVDGEIKGTTNVSGEYTLDLAPGKYQLSYMYLGYESENINISIIENERKELNIGLAEGSTLLETATVTAGKYNKKLGEVTVSMEVLKPKLLENANSVSVDEVLQKVPGLQITDGQPAIRGGSGYSYGAGSRVLLLVDDLPFLQGDAGFPNWTDIPVENIGQIEVLKGAASALYGSSALNGIIHIRTAAVSLEPVVKVSSFLTFFDAPEDPEQKWWGKGTDSAPFWNGLSFAYRQKVGKKLDVVFGANRLNKTHWRKTQFSNKNRFNINLKYRITDRLAVGVGSNFNFTEGRNFFYWQNDTIGALIPTEGTTSDVRNDRINVDPYITYFDKFENRHKVMTRYYSVWNKSENNQSNSSQLYYGEYQFVRRFQEQDMNIAAGLTGSQNNSQALLYGDTTFSARNAAIYAQIDKRFFKKLNISLGARYESNTIQSPDSIEGTIISEPKVTESKPVFRAGASYQVGDFSYLRASWGQGYRFPTIAEKFINTQIGILSIFPNPNLQSETGWSAEIGYKQGFKIGGFKGYTDLSLFWTKYFDMMEFTFGGVDQTLFGFQSVNVGNTEIRGVEWSVAGRGKLGAFETDLIMGYTFIDPKFQHFYPDTTGLEFTDNVRDGYFNAIFSSSDENILKYRNKHSFKFDIETKYKGFSVGFAGRYLSFMEAVDSVFETLIPGVGAFRAKNNKGTFIGDLRLSHQFDDLFKMSFIINNIFNETYTLRPALQEAPRNFSIRMDINLN